METVYKPDEGRISVAEAKRLILSASPDERVISVYLPTDEKGDVIPGADFELRPGTVSRYAMMLDTDLPPTFVELGIEPRLRWRLPVKDYSGAKDDDSYFITHEEFVKLAKHHDVAVVVGEPPIKWTADAAKTPKPVQRSAAHEAALLAALNAAGYNPSALPAAKPGKASAAKEAARSALPAMTRHIFDKTWQRLRNEKQISDGAP